MFDYKGFKKEMENRGHEVTKKGKYIKIVPNNNYYGYGKGFMYAEDIISDCEKYLGEYFAKCYAVEHFNTFIYEARFKIEEKDD